MTPDQQISDLNRRLEMARDFYRKNQAEIASLKATIDEIASIAMSGECDMSTTRSPAVDAVVDLLGECHKANTFANKYRQWCRMALTAGQRAEFSHLLNDETWEVIFSGIEADLENEGTQPPF